MTSEKKQREICEEGISMANKLQDNLRRLQQKFTSEDRDPTVEEKRVIDEVCREIKKSRKIMEEIITKHRIKKLEDLYNF